MGHYTRLQYHYCYFTTAIVINIIFIVAIIAIFKMIVHIKSQD